MLKYSTLFLLALSCILTTACQQKNNLQGSIDYLGDSYLVIEEKPIHYKYAPASIDTLKVNEEGLFNYTIPSDGPRILYLHLQDESYPIIIDETKDLEIQITRSDFPSNVQIMGYPSDWNQSYQQYLEEIDGLDSRITQEGDKFKNGEENDILALSKQKYEIARKHLTNTPLENYYWKALGEYLVFRIRAVEYDDRYKDDFDTDSAREEVVEEAKEFNFFSFESLIAQRAGIRDFAHYYSRTFGIYDSIKAVYDKDLAEYDLKRLGYEVLNEKRLQVIAHIEERDAEAYARMYLVAERIGELPLEVARPSYEAYLEEFSDYPEYTSFLTYFYNEIKSVSPGQPAIPFVLPDINGEMHTMEEYEGKFVLLDFWAGWCQPCLEEFPYMKEIYSKYSRDQLEIVGISNEVDSLVWVQDLKRLNLPWPQLYSGDGFDEKTFKAYKGGGIPFYILVDPDGNIVRYNDIRPTFNFIPVMDSLLSKRQKLGSN